MKGALNMVHGITTALACGEVQMLQQWVVHKLTMTPPAVSRPRDRGVTSSSRRSCTFSLPSPLRIAACGKHHVEYSIQGIDSTSCALPQATRSLNPAKLHNSPSSALHT